MAMGRHWVIRTAQPVGLIAAISSGVQGLTWASFYFAGLLTHYCLLVPDSTNPTFSYYLASYLQNGRCKDEGLACVHLVGPGQLIPWLVLGILFNLLLVAASITLSLVLLRCFKDSSVVFINTWICLSILSFLTDFGLSWIFALDYSSLENTVCLDDRGIGGLVLASLFLFSSRAVLLSVANISFTIFLIVVSRKLHIRYKKNKEMDLSSNWVSTDSSCDFGEAFARDELIGVVNPIQDYPEYSAMARWPTLSNRHNQKQQSRSGDLVEFQTRFNQPDHQISKFDNNSNNIYDGTDYGRNRDNYEVRQRHPAESIHDRIVQTETNQEVRNRSIRSVNPKREPIEIREIPQATVRRNISTVSSSRNPQRIYDSGTLQRSPVPVPPPMPTGSPQSPVITRSQEPFEPDYSPLAGRPARQIQTVSAKVHASTADNEILDARKRFNMTLREAIKNRPPLRPVFRTMKSSQF